MEGKLKKKTEEFINLSCSFSLNLSQPGEEDDLLGSLRICIYQLILKKGTLFKDDFKGHFQTAKRVRSGGS